MTYPLTFYTDNPLPEGVGGQARGPFIFLRPKYRDDEGIYRHELEHVKQGAMLLFVFHNLFYKFHRPYRQWAEVQAYKVQMRYPPYMALDSAARRLAGDRYDLGLSVGEAMAVLTKGKA